jgi:hypothetical protein
LLQYSCKQSGIMLGKKSLFHQNSNQNLSDILKSDYSRNWKKKSPNEFDQLKNDATDTTKRDLIYVCCLLILIEI